MGGVGGVFFSEGSLADAYIILYRYLYDNMLYRSLLQPLLFDPIMRVADESVQLKSACTL